ncbi:MAG: hypothetical protein IT566_11995 [Rhodospirillaceae bacterium]|nr:hypothetical protein [Rhodospirillaceae bacterium]
MLWQLSGLKSFDVHATDGRCGKIADFLIDDTTWRIQWIVGDLGSWVDPHKVLLPPSAFGAPREDKHVFPIGWTRARAATARDSSEAPPVAQQMAAHQASPHLNMAEAIAITAGANLLPSSDGASDEVRPTVELNAHLRSSAELIGYEVKVNDGEMGEIEDFVLDDRPWSLTHLVIRWSNWWRPHHVIVPARSVQSIDWRKKKIRLALSADEIRSASPLEMIEVHGRDFAPRRTGWESVM